MAIALATVDQLISRINGVESDGLRELLYESLCSATLQISSLAKLGSLNEAQGVVHDFYVTRDIAVRNHRYLKLRCNNSFINEAANVVSVVYGATETDLQNATPIDAQFIKTNKARGVVQFDSFGFNSDLTQPAISRRIPINFVDYTFRVTYDHGLALKSTADGKVYDGVPDWLEEAALIKAREIYQKTNPSKDRKAEDISSNLALLIDPNMRVEPMALDPVFDD